jgi:hypothetical protein
VQRRINGIKEATDLTRGKKVGKECEEKPRAQPFFYCLLKIEFDIDGRKDARWDELSRSPPEYQLE